MICIVFASGRKCICKKTVCIVKEYASEQFSKKSKECKIQCRQRWREIQFRKMVSLFLENINMAFIWSRFFIASYCTTMNEKKNAHTFFFSYFALISMHFLFPVTFSSVPSIHIENNFIHSSTYSVIDLHKMQFSFSPYELNIRFDEPFCLNVNDPFFAFHKNWDFICIGMDFGWNGFVHWRLLHVFDWNITGRIYLTLYFHNRKCPLILPPIFSLNMEIFVHSMPFIRLVLTTSFFNWKSIAVCSLSILCTLKKLSLNLCWTVSTTVLNKQNRTLSVWSAFEIPDQMAWHISSRRYHIINHEQLLEGKCN